jgi:DNA-binding XRE family transcriptional regulator
MPESSAQSNQGRVENYLRTHRIKAGLGQHEIGRLFGYKREGPVSRHERAKALPSLRIAIAYEILFRTPVSKLFPGVKKDMQGIVERRLLQLEGELQKKTAKGNEARRIAQKLAWFSERRNIDN